MKAMCEGNGGNDAMKRTIRIVSRGETTVTITATVNTNGAKLARDESEAITRVLADKLMEAPLGLPYCSDHSLRQVRVTR